METIKTAIFQPWNKYTAKKIGFKTKAAAREKTKSTQGKELQPALTLKEYKNEKEIVQSKVLEVEYRDAAGTTLKVKLYTSELERAVTSVTTRRTADDATDPV
jgi:hypothetical protein